MSRFRGGAAALLVLAMVALAGIFWSRPRRPEVNILLITLDTTRADHLGCYGADTAETPTLDRIAAEGILFERCHSPAPLTLPSHATLFTALHPPEHGLRTNGRGGLDPKIATLPAVLKDAGYATAAFVSSFVLDSRFGLGRGFDTYDDDWPAEDPLEAQLHQQRGGRQTIDAALAWLNAVGDKPYFCWIHLYDPHLPYSSHAELFGDKFAERPYAAEIAYVDREIARLQSFLDERGQTERTVVVIVGDHGEGLGEHVERTHGYTLYNATQQIPLIVRAPGRIPAGSRVPTSFPLIDLAPTLLDLVGISAGLGPSGKSAHQAITTGVHEHRLCYSATDDPYLQNGWSPLRSLVLGNWKYIRTTQPELYDLGADWGETNNLIESNPAERREMEDRLRDFEAAMRIGSAVDVQLTSAEVTALRGLGYIGAAQGDSNRNSAPSIPALDVKEMLPLDVRAEDAQILIKSGQFREARELLQANLEQSRWHLASCIFLGELLERMDQRDEAAKLYEQVLVLKSDHVDALVHLGAVLALRGADDKAVHYFDEALRVDSSSSSARYNLALVLTRQGQLREAIRQLEELLQSDPRFGNAHAALANCWLAAGATSKAIEEFRQELRVHPRSMEARLNLATLLAESSPEESEQLLRGALEMEPDSPAILYNLGAYYLFRQRPAKAIPYFEQALQIQPGHPQATKELERAIRMVAGP